MPSLITEMGTFLLRAMLAQEWRATYIVSGCDNPIFWAQAEFPVHGFFEKC